MMPEPLHPAVVHFPIALALLTPLLALGALLAIRRGWLPARIWIAVVLAHALLAGSAWLAVETGEDQEERVEEVVRESAIEEHEEAAERFLSLAIGVGVVSAAGLLRGGLGLAGRGATVAAGALALAAAVATGHSGGELVYRHGAADAYVREAKTAQGQSAGASAARREHVEDDD
jgi:uncharacterized membrane protein